ncbi:MAG: hypothetical protein A2252_11490 [Elusimicrobia bacterium RIFOXYA2_FULL_39_19]|nr:MAG: hypothetical protein A2252_11490 [Elusimicrobia bacterium RIFOXYA2_FULL_39_19]
MSIFESPSLEKFINIPANAREILRKPEKRITINIGVWFDSKKLTVCEGYIVYHNTVRGPAKGGIRIAADVTLEETMDLAERMTLKTALTGIPFGGGKSGICLDNKNLTPYEKKEIIKEYVHLIRNELTSGNYIPAPDIGTGPREMAIIYGELHIPECVTGKPISIGGLPGRKEATGYGVAMSAIHAYNKYFKKDIKDVKVAVQGFGNVGSWAAGFLFERGAKIVAVSDFYSGIYNKEGLDIKKLNEYLKEKGKVEGFPVADKISNEELLCLSDIEILIPAAVERVINEKTAPKIKAKLIVEGANGPTTPDGDKILDEKGIIVVPDILANSGGVIGSYIEWKSSKSGSITPVSEVYKSISDLIIHSFERVSDLAQKEKLTNRNASLVLATQEVINAMNERGWI